MKAVLALVIDVVHATLYPQVRIPASCIRLAPPMQLKESK